MSILSILLFTGVWFKRKKKEEEVKEEVSVQKFERTGEFQLKTTNDKIINLKLENEKIVLTDYPNKIVLLSFYNLVSSFVKQKFQT